MIEQNREKYKRDLEDRQRKLEAYLGGLDAIAAYSIKTSGKAYGQASSTDDAIKACGKLTKSGAHIHGKMGLDTVKTIMQLHDQLYQIGVVCDHLQNLEEENNEID